MAKLDQDAIYRAALSLPQDARADLADKLFESLSEVANPDIDARWAREAEDRVSAYERGEIASVPGHEVFAALRSRQKG
jgi:putative addiction module component (TIGR02574 family)